MQVQNRLICTAIILSCSALSWAGGIDVATLKLPAALSYSATIKVTNFRQSPKGEVSNVAIAFKTDGVRFRYSQKGIDKPKTVFDPIPTSCEVVYDGLVTVITVDGQTASVEEGPNFRTLTFLPFPGIGLPGTPLARPKSTSTSQKALAKVPPGFQLCEVPVITGGKRARFKYMNGIAKIDASSKVIEVMSGLPIASIDRWQFQNHREIEGQWVAHRATWEHHSSDPKTGLSTGTDELREYVFSDVTFNRPSPTEYDASSILTDGALVAYVNADGKSGQFPYKSGKTWAAMSPNVPGLVRVSESKNSKLGLVLGVLVFVCGVIFVYQVGVAFTRRAK